MDIHLDPDIHLGPLAVSWHGLFTAVGIFFGVGLAVRLLRGKVREDDAYFVATWGVVAGILGARLFHVLDAWSYYSQHPEQILFIWTGGIAVWGAVIGGIVGGTAAALRRGVRLGPAADAAAPGLALGLAIGRIGDVINGEHHATPCEPPAGICVTYSHPDTLGQGPVFAVGDRRFAEGPVHLAVGYDMLWLLAIVGLALFLWWRRERGRPMVPTGTILWLFLLLYGLDRFVVSFTRVGEPTSVLGLRQDQLVGLLAMAVAAGALVAVGLVRGRRPAPGPT